MPARDRKLLKDDLNGDTLLDTACTVQERMLQALEGLKWDDQCSSWGPDLTAIGGTWL